MSLDPEITVQYWAGLGWAGGRWVDEWISRGFAVRGFLRDMSVVILGISCHTVRHWRRGRGRGGRQAGEGDFFSSVLFYFINSVVSC